MTLLVQFSKIYSCFGYKNLLNSLLNASIETLFLNWWWICVRVRCLVRHQSRHQSEVSVLQSWELSSSHPWFPQLPMDIGKLFSKMPRYWICFSPVLIFFFLLLFCFVFGFCSGYEMHHNKCTVTIILLVPYEKRL